METTKDIKGPDHGYGAVRQVLPRMAPVLHSKELQKSKQIYE
jgi:hypothetical protein